MNRASIAAAGLVATVVATPAAASGLSALAFSDTVFASIDSDDGSVFAATGVKRSFGAQGAATRGFIAATSGLSLSDAQRYRRGRMPLDAVDRQARAVIGVEQSAGIGFVSLGFGLSHALAKWSTRPARWRTGVALEANIWLRPDARQHVALAMLGDTAAGSLWARLRYGYRPDGWLLAIGPEVGASVTRSSGKAKIGLHLSDLKLWRMEAVVSGGVMWDERHRPGLYAAGSLWVTY